MGTGEPELLALQAAYGSLYNEFIRPEQKYTVSHYLRTQWAPLLGAARLWFVVALRQRCYWNERQEWCVVDKKTLARESGLSSRTINRIVAADGDPQPADERDGWASWFFSKKRRRRYDLQVGRTVNAPNRYHVLLDDPLTPQHQAGLAHYLQQHTAGGGAQETLQALEALCALSDEARREVLESAPPGADPPIPAAFVLDVVEACCPPPDNEALQIDIARAALRLHQAITCPERVYIGTQYFRRQWLPRLGPVSALVVVNLRARCYWNERTGELRDTCRASWTELAAEVGCTPRQLRYLRQDEALQRFVTVESEGHGAARSRFGVQVLDLLTDEDAARFERRLVQWARAQPGFAIDPESGQLDALPLLLQAPAAASGRQGAAPHPAWTLAEILAPGSPGTAAGAEQARGGQAEVLAPGTLGAQDADPASDPDGRDGQAEILASRSVREGPPRDVEMSPMPLLHSDQAEVLAPARAESRIRRDTDSTPPADRQDHQAEILALGMGNEAEVLAPGAVDQAAILAVGGRQFWRIEGLQAEVLAPQAGNFGTTGKLLFITLDSKGLSTAALELSATLCQDPERLAAAVRHLFLLHLGIEEPNRSRLLRRHPPCAQIAAWGLYALTQRGLQNRAGYVYRRLLTGDPAPPDLVELVGLPPPIWRGFVSAVRNRQEHLLPEALYDAFQRWYAVFAPLWSEIELAVGPGSPADLEGFVEQDVEEGGHEAPPLQDQGAEGGHETPSDSVIASAAKQSPTHNAGDRFVAPRLTMTDVERVAKEGGHEAPPLQEPGTGDDGAASLPPEVGALLQEGETGQRIDDRWLLVTPTLFRACWLYHQVKASAPQVAARMGVIGDEGQIHLVKADVLAIPAEPLPDDQWAAIAAGLRLRMGQKAFDRWWPEVQPLGLTGGLGHDPPNLLLCVPGQELCRHLTEQHTEVAEWTCISVLHHPLRVLFLAYCEKTLQPAPAPT